MLRNLVLLIAIALGGGAGYWFGSWSGRDAKAALAKVRQDSEAAKAAHDRTRADLEKRMAALTEDFQKEAEQLREATAEREQSMTQVIAQRAGRIAELEKLQAGKQAEIRSLQARAAIAATPEERVRIVKEIERVQGEERVIVVEADGRKCQAVPVPDDLLAAWRGGKP